LSKAPAAKMISLEGIEGVGKTTNMDFLEKLLRQKKIDLVRTREPGGTVISEAIRQILLRKDDEALLPLTEVLLLYAGRHQHVQHVIQPALEANKWVLCDRFFDATIAYQGGGREISVEKILELNKWVLGNFKPNDTIILDAPVPVALERIQKRKELDRIEEEKVDFFERVRAQYLALAEREPKRFWVVDASGDLESVQKQLEYIVGEIVLSADTITS
tara:strand:- start:226028 stop:226681 length:654 start_codon:yes stop_codon:yes gene_type:complete